MPEYIYPDDELDIDENEVFVGFIRKNCEMLIRCKDCKYFESDHIEPVGNITVIFAHEICTKCGRRCKTNENGFCHLAERK